MKWLNSIALWWKFEGRYYHTEFVKGVKNLIRWFPIIWKDRDWDHHFIFSLLIQKIKFQAKYIGDRDFHTRAKRDAQIMMTCVRLMEKVKEEYYNIEYIDYHKDRVWFTDCEDRPGSYLYNSEEVWEKYDEYFAKYPLIYKKVLKGEGVFTLNDRDESDMKRIIAMNIAHLNHDRARKLLFKLLERNIQNWWD